MSDEKRPPDTLGVAGPSHASDQCTLSAERVIDSRENEQHIVCACKKEKNEHTEESSLADGILAKIKKEVMETIQFKSKLVNHKDLPGTGRNIFLRKYENFIRIYILNKYSLLFTGVFLPLLRMGKRQFFYSQISQRSRQGNNITLFENSRFCKKLEIHACCQKPIQTTIP